MFGNFTNKSKFSINENALMIDERKLGNEWRQSFTIKFYMNCIYIANKLIVDTYSYWSKSNKIPFKYHQHFNLIRVLNTPLKNLKVPKTQENLIS